MNKAFVVILILGVVASGFYACRVDNPLDTDEQNLTYNPTAYEFNLPEYAPPMPKSPPGNPMTKEGVVLGRKLFYEKRLSSDNTKSCASCHDQSFGFTDQGRQYSEGVLGIEGTRNSLPLSNLHYGSRFFSPGRAPSLA
jgi:cytochrome c peroxidase